MAQRRTGFESRAARLRSRELTAKIAQRKQDLGGLSRRLSAVGRNQISALDIRLKTADRMLATLGYEATLERGYAVIRAEGEVVTRKAEAEGAATLEIQFADGRMTVGGKPARKPSKAAPEPDQGSLF